jgi:hypothetical protein
VILAYFEVVDLPKRARLPFLRAAAGDGVAGGRLYDAHIAEIARSAACTLIVTENVRHFVSVTRHGIRVATPSELTSTSVG